MKARFVWVHLHAHVRVFQEFDGKFLLSSGQKLFSAASGVKEHLKCAGNRYTTMANNQKSPGHYCTERTEIYFSNHSQRRS